MFGGSKKNNAAAQRPTSANNANAANTYNNLNKSQNQTTGTAGKTTGAYGAGGQQQKQQTGNAYQNNQQTAKGTTYGNQASNQAYNNTYGKGQTSNQQLPTSVPANRKKTLMEYGTPQQLGIQGCISMITKCIEQDMGKIPSVLHYFQDWDCYLGRVFDTWELNVIFGGRIDMDVFKQISEVNQTKERLFNDQVSFKFLSLELETSGAFPQIQTSAQPQYSIYEEKWKLRVDNDLELKNMCKELSVQRDVAYNPAEAFDRLFPHDPQNPKRNMAMGVNQNEVHRALNQVEIRATPQTTARFMDFVRTRQLRDSVVDKVMLVNVFKFLLSRYNYEAANQLKNGSIPLEQTNEPTTKKEKLNPVQSVNPKAIASPRQGGATNKTNNNLLQVNQPPLIGKSKLSAALDDMLLDSNDSRMQPDTPGAPGLERKTALPETPRGNATSSPQKRTLTRSGGGVNVQLDLTKKTGTTTPTVNLANAAQNKIANAAQKITTNVNANTATTQQEVDSQALLIANKICAHLDMNNKSVQQLMEIQSHPVILFKGQTMGYAQPDFIQVLETKVCLSPGEALFLSQQFLVQQAGDATNYVDQRRFEDLINGQRAKYSKILVGNKNDLLDLVKGMRERRTGPYKWFLTFSQGSSVITRVQWEKAVDPLLPKSTTSLRKCKIFDALDDNTPKRKEVELTDIEGLFKALSREKFKDISQVEKVMISILQAFGVDDVFLDRELSRLASENSGILLLEPYVNFFSSFPGHEKFYTLDEVTALGEVFVIGQGQIDLQQFQERLLQTKRKENMQRSQGFAGIQTATLLGVNRDGSAFTPHQAFAGSSPDGTRAYEQVNLQRPINFQPQVQDDQIQDLQKACFLMGTLVEDYFARFTNYAGGIALPGFSNACRGLELQYKWDPYFDGICAQLFQEIDRSFHNGRPMAEITKQDIDQFVHHVAKKKIEDIHRDLVYDIHQKLELRRGQTIAIDMAFKQAENNRSGNTVTAGDVQTILQHQGIDLRNLDVKFLCSQYVQANMPEQVHYLKFLDDLRHAGALGVSGGLASKFSVGINSRAAAGQDQRQKVCEAIVKKLYVLRLDYKSAMEQWCRSQFMTEQAFHEIFGEKLSLVPQYASAADLKQVFQELGRGQPSVAVHDVWTHITKLAPKSVNEMQADLLQTISERVADVQSIFERDPHFQQGRGQLSFHSFTTVLTSQLFLHQLNADFLATFYIGFNQQVDAQRFLQDHQQHARVARPSEVHRNQYHNPASQYNQTPYGANQTPYGSNQTPYGSSNQYNQNTYDPLQSSQNRYDQNQLGGASNRGFGPLETVNQNEFFKAVLKKIVEAVNSRNLELAYMFGKHQTQASGPYLSKMDFHSVLRRQVVDLDYTEVEVLEKKYAHPSPHQHDMLDVQKFLEDIKSQQIALRNSQQLSQLTDGQKKNYKTLTDSLAKGGVLTQLVLQLKTRDVNDIGYLSQKNILDAINETLKKKSATSKTLAEANVKGLLVGAVSQNSHGLFSYKEFVQHLIGVEKGQQLCYLDLRQLTQEAERERLHGSAAASGFIQPQGISNPENNMLGNIGQKLLMASAQTGTNYEEYIRAKLGANAQDMNLDEFALATIFKEMGIFLSVDETQAHQAWFGQRRDRANRVPADVWLKALGLPCQTIKVAKAQSQAKRKLLSEEQLSTCQGFLREIAQEFLKGSGGKLDKIVEKYRDPSAISLKPPAFKRMLKQELSAPTMKRLTDDHIKNMIHYLVREEPGVVSFEKLYLALQQAPGKPPLTQEGVEQLRAYTAKVGEQLQEATVPVAVLHLLVWMQGNNYTLTTLFMVQPNQLKGTIPATEFWKALDRVGYIPKDKEALLDALDHDRKRTVISFPKLQEAQKLFKKDAGGGTMDAKRRYGNLDQLIRAKIEKISEHLKANNFTTTKVHEMLDSNKDGYVDKMEFLVGMEQHFPIPTLTKRDYNSIFDAIDIDDNGFLSVNEFCLYIEGAQLTRDQRISQIPQEILNDINLEIGAFFSQFDENKDGVLEAREIQTSMRGLGYTTITLEKAEEMIASVSKKNAKTIDKDEFTLLMQPVMLDMLLAAEDNVEEYRDMFRQADTDYSGYLSADEIYAVLLQNGVTLSMEELVELMQEFDLDGNAQLEIDEFVAMMSLGDNLSFAKQGSATTYLKIRKARKLNVMDFMKAFSNLPAAFTPSTSTEMWKQKKNLPSGILKPQVDPRTMLWKDMYPVISEMLTPEMQKPDNKPQFRPMESKLGIEITLESAEGIILPKNSDTFKRDSVLKRAVRVGIFDDVKQQYVANIIQVPAEWTAGKDGNWRFNTKKDIGLNPVIFRQSAFEVADPAQHSLVFEFVIYLQNGVGAEMKVTELSCGFAKLKIEMAARDLSKYKVPVEGGSPMAVEKIRKEDQDAVAKKGVLGGLFGGGTVNSTLMITTRQNQALEEDTKLHLTMLPGLCLVHKRMIHFVSGFRNYSAQKLLSVAASGEFKQPGGNVAIATFPAVCDNPEIMEALVRVWTEDVINLWPADKKKSVRLCMTMAEAYLSKLYPVLFSYDFDLGPNTTDSAIGNKHQYQLRKELIEAALRYDPAKKGAKVAKAPLEALTQFKPFNVREIQFEVWDARKAMHEQMLQRFDGMGVVSAAAGLSARQSQTNMNQFLEGRASLQTGANYSLLQQERAATLQQPPLQQPALTHQTTAGGHLAPAGANTNIPAQNSLKTPAFSGGLNQGSSEKLLQSPASPRNPTISVTNLDKRGGALSPPNGLQHSQNVIQGAISTQQPQNFPQQQVNALGDTPSFKAQEVAAPAGAAKVGAGLKPANAATVGAGKQPASAQGRPGLQQQQPVGQQAATNQAALQNYTNQAQLPAGAQNNQANQAAQIQTAYQAPAGAGRSNQTGTFSPPSGSVKLPTSPPQNSGRQGSLPRPAGLTVSVSKDPAQGVGGTQAAANSSAGRASNVAATNPNANIPVAGAQQPASPRKPGMKIQVGVGKK